MPLAKILVYAVHLHQTAKTQSNVPHRNQSNSLIKDIRIKAICIKRPLLSNKPVVARKRDKPNLIRENSKNRKLQPLSYTKTYLKLLFKLHKILLVLILSTSLNKSSRTKKLANRTNLRFCIKTWAKQLIPISL